ncbi:glucose 1-dehydrogenase [Microbulbifer elongatus]|uniref:Glucose 1-dehydrogenase n=1 Tax=Microbulbifer elongatus TaxID=86173 RepID=A0ABT1NXL5_9GAMM|nr:glucose 1-dehydrogenase [Microbulbifer elongatus]
MQQQFGLEGKVAMVTGASRGLGKAMAMALGRAGARVVVVASTPDSAENAQQELSAEGIDTIALGCDQSQPAQIDALFREVESRFGRLDILVNNAGTIRRAPAVDYSDDDWNAVMDTNINGVFRMCRAAGAMMLKQGSGKIINIASLLSFSGGITVPAYAASKGAVSQLTKALANEWAANNIQVNAIAPGYFATDNTANLRADAERNAAISARIPAGRWGNPEDLAGAAVFLASPAANYMNGHIMLIDGGWMAR